MKMYYAGINGGCETFRARGEFLFKRQGKEGQPVTSAGSAYTLGAEGCGVVVAVGAGVEKIKVRVARFYQTYVARLCSVSMMQSSRLYSNCHVSGQVETMPYSNQCSLLLGRLRPEVARNGSALPEDRSTIKALYQPCACNIHSHAGMEFNIMTIRI